MHHIMRIIRFHLGRILVIALLKKELKFDDILDRMPVGQINNVGYILGVHQLQVRLQIRCIFGTKK